MHQRLLLVLGILLVAVYASVYSTPKRGFQFGAVMNPDWTSTELAQFFADDSAGRSNPVISACWDANGHLITTHVRPVDTLVGPYFTLGNVIDLDDTNRDDTNLLLNAVDYPNVELASSLGTVSHCRLVGDDVYFVDLGTVGPVTSTDRLHAPILYKVNSENSASVLFTFPEFTYENGLYVTDFRRYKNYLIFASVNPNNETTQFVVHNLNTGKTGSGLVNGEYYSFSLDCEGKRVYITTENALEVQSVLLSQLLGFADSLSGAITSFTPESLFTVDSTNLLCTSMRNWIIRASTTQVGFHEVTLYSDPPSSYRDGDLDLDWSGSLTFTHFNKHSNDSLYIFGGHFHSNALTGTYSSFPSSTSGGMSTAYTGTVVLEGFEEADGDCLGSFIGFAVTTVICTIIVIIYCCYALIKGLGN